MAWRRTSPSPPTARCWRAGPGAQGRGPEPRDREPGCLDDAVFRPHERCGLSGGRRAGRHRGRCRAQAQIKVNMVVKRAAPTTHEILAHGATFAARARCASLNTWTWAPPTAGAWTKVLPSAELIERLRADCPGAAGPQQPRGRNRRALGLCRRQRPARPGAGRVGVISSVTRAFHPRLQLRAAPPTGRSTCACLPARATTCARLLRGGASDDIASFLSRPSGSSATTAIPNCAAPRPQTTPGRAA